MQEQFDTGYVNKSPDTSGFAKSKSNKTVELQSIHDSRSTLSKSSDERQEHSTVVEPDDPAVEKWLKDQSRMDVRGIDTPRKKSKPKTRKQGRTSGRDIGIRQIRG
jgi:hypothetical protein